MYNSDDYKRHINNKIEIDLSKRRPNYVKPIICMFMKIKWISQTWLPLRKDGVTISGCSICVSSPINHLHKQLSFFTKCLYFNSLHVNMTFDDSSYIKTCQNYHITLLFVEFFDNKNVLVSEKLFLHKN